MQKKISRLVTDVTVPEGNDTIDYQSKDRFLSFDTRIPLTGLWLLTKNTGDVDAILSCQSLTLNLLAPITVGAHVNP